jgi:hypothetical protein
VVLAVTGLAHRRRWSERALAWSLPAGQERGRARVKRRDWVHTFADPAILSDLFAAAQSCMSQVCSHDPAECDCRENLMTPLELAQWVEREIHANGGMRHHRPAGQPNRRRDGQARVMPLDLSIAG